MGPARRAAADGTDVGMQSAAVCRSSRFADPNCTLFTSAHTGDSGGLPGARAPGLGGFASRLWAVSRGLDHLQATGFEDVSSCSRSPLAVLSAVTRWGLKHVHPFPMTARMRRLSSTSRLPAPTQADTPLATRLWQGTEFQGLYAEKQS